MPFTIIVKKKDLVYNGAVVHRTEVSVPSEMEEFNVNIQRAEKAPWFEVMREDRAKMLAEYLAAAYPGSEVVISEQKLIYQSEKPKISSKEVSERGVLPV